MFLISNSDKYGQFYYDEKNKVLYKCYLKYNKNQNEIVPYGWFFPISFFASFYVCVFLNHPVAALIVNVLWYSLGLILSYYRLKKESQYIKEHGTRYILNVMELSELKEIKYKVDYGMYRDPGFMKQSFGGFVWSLLIGAIVFFVLKDYVFSISTLLSFLIMWKYNEYYNSFKPEKRLSVYINGLLDIRE